MIEIQHSPGRVLALQKLSFRLEARRSKTNAGNLMVEDNHGKATCAVRLGHDSAAQIVCLFVAARPLHVAHPKQEISGGDPQNHGR